MPEDVPPRVFECRCRFYLSRCWDLESALAAGWLLGLEALALAAPELEQGLALALAAEVAEGSAESLAGDHLSQFGWGWHPFEWGRPVGWFLRLELALGRSPQGEHRGCRLQR